MFIAVSTLSPVKTHTLIPARFKSCIVFPTSTYNLSSMAVDPTKVKSYSISSATLLISLSLFTETEAFLY